MRRARSGLDPRDRGKPLAGKSTLNRLELTPAEANAKSRYKKIVARQRQTCESWFVEAFLQLHSQPPEEIVLDLDATDDPIHGHQVGRFFHGYYDSYCYLPLYIFCGEHLLLRQAAAGRHRRRGRLACKQVARIVAQIRQRLAPGADHPARRQRLLPREPDALVRGEPRGLRVRPGEKRALTQDPGPRAARGPAAVRRPPGQPARLFKDFTYRTRKSWSRERRVVGKAEHLAKGSNPRFVVTSLSAERLRRAGRCTKSCYCARGEMENRIKEQQLCLFADRTSCQTMRANQLRLWLSSAAYVLLQALRQHGLKDTPLAQARCDTIRLKLLKIGAVVRVTVRRVWFSLSGSYPYQELFRQVLDQSAAVENATASGPHVNRRRPVHVRKFEWPFRLSDALAAARTTRNRLPHEPLPALYAPHPCHFRYSLLSREATRATTTTTRPNHRHMRQSFSVVRNAG